MNDQLHLYGCPALSIMTLLLLYKNLCKHLKVFDFTGLLCEFFVPLSTLFYVDFFFIVK